jgi:hypothetical protein
MTEVARWACRKALLTWNIRLVFQGETDFIINLSP